MLTVVVPSAGGRHLSTLITSKPRFTNPSETTSAGVDTARCHITAFYRLLGLVI
jgi:hypothetical protein